MATETLTVEQIESLREYSGYRTGPDIGQWADLNDAEVRGLLCDAALRGLRSQGEVAGWISVNDRLPIINQGVLAYNMAINTILGQARFTTDLGNLYEGTPNNGEPVWELLCPYAKEEGGRIGLGPHEVTHWLSGCDIPAPPRTETPPAAHLSAQREVLPNGSSEAIRRSSIRAAIAASMERALLENANYLLSNIDGDLTEVIAALRNRALLASAGSEG